jgi:SAM-dependent methyltransferase
VSGYAWPNSAGGNPRERLECLQALYDLRTFENLRRAGVRAGWDCLEAGAGGGSVAGWLAQMAFPGRVLAADIDTSLLRVSDEVGVQRMDVATDDLGGPWDLIHARLLLYHLPNRKEVLSRMVAALKPGGRLVIEDFDNGIVPDPSWDEVDGGALICFYWQALNQVFAKRGADPVYARNLPLMMADAGLEVIDVNAQLVLSQGGSAGARLQAANIMQSHAELVATGLLQEHEAATLLDVLADSRTLFFQPVMISVTGWKR